MKNNKKNKINPKYVLAALSLLCIAGIGLSLFRGFSRPSRYDRQFADGAYAGGHQ